MSEPLIELKDVFYTLEGRDILSAVTLSVESGRIMTIIGPNGAGKTTLLRLMLGFIPPTQGMIHRSVGVIGYMPQKLTLNPLLPLTVRRFLQLSQPHSNRNLNDRIDEILHEVGACHLSESFMTVLSGGEMQRVLLARSLMLDAALLILDEPAQGVDVLGQSELYGLIARIRDQRGCGIVLVSHDLHLVMAASDEVVCLNHHICCSGSPQLVQQDPQYLDLFGGSPASAIAVYAHHHDHYHDVSGECSHAHSSTSSKGDI